jgi:iron complex transport system substrate-binding protein
VTQGKHETLAAFAAEYDIPFLTLDLDTLADIHAAIASLARALNVDHRGVEVRDGIRNALASVRKQVENADPKRVLLLFGRMPGDLTGLSTVGPGTFIDEMIGIAGGVNIYGDAKGVYPQVSKESLLIRKPQVILEVNPGGLREETIDRLRAD